MRPVTVYTRAFCPCCTRALALLRRKGGRHRDRRSCPQKRQEMIARSGGWTFPQTFVGDTHIGGCDELHALENRGGLDPLLTGT